MWRECKFHCRLWDARVDEAIHSFGCLSRFAEQRCIGLLYYKYTLFNLAVVFNFIFLNIYFFTTFSDGCLGSRNDEERSEMRYVMRIAEFSESSNLWTQIALQGFPWSMLPSVSFSTTSATLLFCKNKGGVSAGKWASQAVTACVALRRTGSQLT